mmetsp:Transcript_24129/g.24386  ORF Transcript_24129/g.24386 Transcript_24129/m.24386 type:complete len:250 (-) Transcript_24129:400-1149(-)
MSAMIVQPEYSRISCVTSSRYCETNPVTDSGILRLTHPPYVSMLHLVLEDHLPCCNISYIYSTIIRDFKSLVMRAIFLCFLSHQSYIRHTSHSGNIKLIIGLHIRDHLLISGGVAAIRDNALHIFQLIVFVPHVSGVTDHTRHGRIDDDVTRHMKVSDTSCRVHHSEPRTFIVTVGDIILNLLSFIIRKRFNLVEHILKTIIRINTKFSKLDFMFVKRFFIKSLHGMTEHDGVRHLHHRGFQMKRRHHL